MYKMGSLICAAVMSINTAHAGQKILMKYALTDLGDYGTHYIAASYSEPMESRECRRQRAAFNLANRDTGWKAECEKSLRTDPENNGERVTVEDSVPDWSAE